MARDVHPKPWLGSENGSRELVSFPSTSSCKNIHPTGAKICIMEYKFPRFSDGLEFLYSIDGFIPVRERLETVLRCKKDKLC